jgi:multiple sugar transport system permease protein
VVSCLKQGWGRKILIYVLSLIVLAFVLGPFIWIFLCSLQGEADLFVVPPNWIPKRVILDNYRYIFTGEIPTAYEVRGLIRSRISQEARYILPTLVNSFTIALFVTLINLCVSSLAAYAFSRFSFKGKTPLYIYIITSRLLPAMAIAVPFYFIIKSLNLLDTKLAIILIHGVYTIPFSTWFLTLYFNEIPSDMEDAALIDGCNPLQAFRYILLPLAIPGLTAIAAFSFVFSYSEFLFPLLITQTLKSKTMPVLIASLSNNPDVSYALLSVCVVLAVIPLLVIGFFFRNYVTKGMTISIFK